MESRIRVVLERAARSALCYIAEKAPVVGEGDIKGVADAHLEKLEQYSQQDFLDLSLWVKEVRTRWAKEGK